ANRTFHPSCEYSVKTRNRLEIRRVQDDPKTLYRARQKTTIVIPFEGTGILKSYSVSNELFYDVSFHQFSQDRLCPFLLTFAPSHKSELDLYFLVRFFDANNTCQKSAVLGTQLSF